MGFRGQRWSAVGVHGRAHPRKPDGALLVVHIHEEEDDPRLEVSADVVDDEALSDVVDLDVRVVACLDGLVATLMLGDASHVGLDSEIRIPALELLGEGVSLGRAQASAGDVRRAS